MTAVVGIWTPTFCVMAGDTLVTRDDGTCILGASKVEHLDRGLLGSCGSVRGAVWIESIIKTQEAWEIENVQDLQAILEYSLEDLDADEVTEDVGLLVGSRSGLYAVEARTAIAITGPNPRSGVVVHGIGSGGVAAASIVYYSILLGGLTGMEQTHLKDTCRIAIDIVSAYVTGVGGPVETMTVDWSDWDDD